MHKFIVTLVVSAGLIAPALPLASGQTPDPNVHRYYDKDHRDYHNWDAREDKAYHAYITDQHRPYVEFNAAPARDQAAYWAWRHNHSDAALKIDVK